MVKHRHVTQSHTQEEPKSKGKIDYLLFTIIMMLAIFGIIMVFDSSAKLLSNKYHFVVLQSLWVTIGLVAMIIMSRYPYRKLAKLSLLFMCGTIILLVAVLVIGQKENGAVRWINIGPLQFQPSELTKPIFITYLAAWFSKEKPQLRSLKEKLKYSFFNEFLPFICLTILVVLLIVIGKDLGTAIIIGIIALGVYFIQGTDILSMINLFASMGVVAIGSAIAIITEPYRISRFLTFAGHSSDTLTSGYQINQILIAIGSGGWLGKGFTQSIQKQRYLVETTAATDSIFAVIAEEFGFLGSLFLLAGYGFLFFRSIRISLKTDDRLGKLMAMGIVIWICAQTLLNIAVNVNLVPLTGVPLPLISYGGSSTIITMASLGILLNISKEIESNKPS